MLKYNNFILESQIIAGKNTFKCFLKVLTALGLKDTKPNWEKTKIKNVKRKPRLMKFSITIFSFSRKRIAVAFCF